MQYTVSELYDLSHSVAGDRLAACTYPWEALPQIEQWILEIGATLDPKLYDHPAPDIWIAKSAEVSHSAVIEGPTIIGEGAKIRQFACVHGRSLIGAEATVGHCTEVKNAILFDGAQVPHFNYVGDSILGYRSHLGGGALLSNFRSDGGNITVHVGELAFQTGLRKVGAFIGDFGEIGAGAVLNPGTVIGRRAIVYPLVAARGAVPEQHIYKERGNVVPRVM